MSNRYPKQHEQFGHLTESVLFALATNPSASHLMHKAAVEIMLVKGYPKTDHPELRRILAEVREERAAKAEVEAIVEAATEEAVEDLPVYDISEPAIQMLRDQCLPDLPSGVGFTTKSMFQEERVPIDDLEV